MEEDPWRLTVRLKSRRVLKQFVDFKGFTGRGLAREADLGQAIVGHLLSGRRTTCSLKTAQAIEEALELPSGFLFEPTLSTVADTTRRTERKSA